MGKKWIALIPAYEPEELLIDLLGKAHRAGFSAVVVDDGSGEAYRELFTRAKEYAVVLTHEENRGKGCALKTGFSYIREHASDGCVVVTLDADGQHRVSDAKRLCRIAQEQPGALVLGSRRLGKDAPFKSRFGNAATRLAFWASTGLWVYDTQTGLRAFDGALLPWLAGIRGERYEYEMNVLLDAARRKIPVREETVETIYIDGNSGSHFHALRDSCRVCGEILKFCASSFVGFLADYAMYALLLLATSGLGAAASVRISNIGARIVSASINYTVNRKLVFGSDQSVAKTALLYAALAAVILAGNTLVLGALVNRLGVNRFAAKICTELLFFVFSWTVQRFWIFRKKKRKGEENGVA